MKISAFILILILSWGCNQTGQNSSQEKPINSNVNETIPVPVFNADSAYSFIEAQVSLGPRVPNTAEHDSCAKYLEKKLSSYGFDIELQESKATAFDGTILKFTNIIASLNNLNKDRIMLCAHWDTRPFSEQDPTNKTQPN